jgi:predicted N-acetyltransferase YhbS
MIRTARPGDVPVLARLINAAFIVEEFFKIGDRTSAEEISDLMAKGGEFLVAEDVNGGVLGCVYFNCVEDRAYFGMLSVDPPSQGLGLGRQLITAVEARAEARGCRFVDIHIVDLRRELPPFYERLGYTRTGELPFSEPDRASRPCHFIVMTKAIGVAI